jgi:DNA-binding PadR family transcriptional regulator
LRNRRPVRLDRKLHAILGVIAASPPTAPAWFRSIRERTGYRTQVILIKLTMLRDAGWITAYDEEAPGERRLYRLTQAGQERYGESLMAEAERKTRRPRWRGPA